MELINLLQECKGDRKVFVIGLDCAAPELVFSQWSDDLPNLMFLARNGIWGELRSCIPAITVPAWTSMLSGKDPGELGIYGFRNRVDYSYNGKFIATSNYVHNRRIWDYLDEAGKKSILVGVPQTYPLKPINGHIISGFLTPGISSGFTYPDSLKEEVLSIAPDYALDVKGFRTENKSWLLQQIQEMTEKRFRVVDHLLAHKPWDFFMLMEIGVDRIHHGFWSYQDPDHRRYYSGNPFEHAIHDYYSYIDEKIGQWLEMIDKDTVVMVVSDHGAKRMDGGICINEWLHREGYLFFKQDPESGQIVSFSDLDVDWSRTRAWGDGGYYGRIFFNVQGREPGGIVDPSAIVDLENELSEKLEALPDPNGDYMGTRVYKPREIYRKVEGCPPDLMVYFGDLLWRSIGSLGHDDIYSFENDTGPDDCNHAQDGMFILYDPKARNRNQTINNLQLTDVFHILIQLLGLDSQVCDSG